MGEESTPFIGIKIVVALVFTIWKQNQEKF